MRIGFRLAGAAGLGAMAWTVSAAAQPRRLEPTPGLVPLGYVCHRAATPPRIDGRLDDASWAGAAWTADFVDIEGDGKPRPALRTRAKMLWDDERFYVAAEIREPHLWATLTRHDSVIFQDDDFEVFIDPDGDSHEYYEFEINALGTGWDLLLPRPYKDGGRAVDHWEIPGLASAVHLDGSLNDPRDTDRGWSVELAFPWDVLGELAHRPSPPRDGDQWRVNFSRVDWTMEIADGRYGKVAGTKENNWVWSPQGVIDMHRPEAWGYVQFSTSPPGSVAFRPDGALAARRWLHDVYYAQREYRRNHKRWARTFHELDVASSEHGTAQRGHPGSDGGPVPGRGRRAPSGRPRPTLEHPAGRAGLADGIDGRRNATCDGESGCAPARCPAAPPSPWPWPRSWPPRGS